MSTHEPILPPRVYGVDFSGAVNAGRTIWIAGGEVVPDVLYCTLCLPAAELPDSGKARGMALTVLPDAAAVRVEPGSLAAIEGHVFV